MSQPPPDARPQPYGWLPPGPSGTGPAGLEQPGTGLPLVHPVRPAVRSPLPTQPVEYHQMLRTPRATWWKGLLVIVSFVAAYLIVSGILQIGAVAIDVARGRVAAGDLLQGKVTLTPSLLIATNLSNVAAIPLSIWLQRAFYGQRGPWLHSVVGRFRWRLLAQSAVVVLPLWAVYVVIGILGAGPSGGGLTGESIALLVIVWLTTPLQAAGEEYGARGLITRAAGSWASDPRLALIIGTVVSSGLFMLAHGAGDPWLIVFYFLFGVGLSIVTWRTGGLEVAILIHAVNNLMAFTIGIVSGQDMSRALDRSDGVGGPEILVPMVLLALVVAGVWWWARRQGVQRSFQPSETTAS